jgi:N-formylglutamate deformylase
MTRPIYRLRQGRIPLLVSMPHTGVEFPADVEPCMTEAARRRQDTDWHLEALYDWIDELGSSVLIPTYSRYVVDLNRPPDSRPLYPDQENTPVCPIDTFNREPLYEPGLAPTDAEVQQRLKTYWHPYHDALAAELARLRQEHGIALLFDAHSVRSVLPRFFEGRLPHINLGTVHGTSCDPALGEMLLETAMSYKHFNSVLDGRYVGGQITRRHGNPAEGIHAVQLELAQSTYMNEEYPYLFDPAKANELRPVLKAMLDGMLNWAHRS